MALARLPPKISENLSRFGGHLAQGQFICYSKFQKIYPDLVATWPRANSFATAHRGKFSILLEKIRYALKVRKPN
jgi:hypothetical protein